MNQKQSIARPYQASHQYNACLDSVISSLVNLALCSMAKMRDRLQKPVACSNLDSGLVLANNNENRHGHFDLIYFFSMRSPVSCAMG